MKPQPWAMKELMERLAAAEDRAARAQIKREFCTAWGLSDSALSRRLCAEGLRSHSRADKGIPRNKVDDAALDAVLAFQCASQSLRKGDIMPARVALHVAEMNGILPEGEVSADWLNRYLRQRGISRAQRLAPTPHVQLASVGPNHVHQIDFSLAVNWKMSKNEIFYDKYQEDPTKLAVTKPGEMRLWRLLIVDHASGVFFPYYGAQTGETVNMLLEGLYYAWAEKKIAGESVAKKFPFRGVPNAVMYDRGPSTKSQIVQNVFARLGVKTILAMAHRAKGSVEVHHNIWEREFESLMRLQKPRTIDELNDFALDSAIGYCSRIVMRRTNMTRIAAWSLLINREPETILRELRCDLKTFLSIALTNPVTRLVRGCVFSFEGREYRVPSALVHNQKVYVQYSPFEYPAVQVRVLDAPEAPIWECQPIEKNHLGFAVDAPIIGREFKSHKKSETGRLIEAARQQADEIAAGQKLKVYGHERFSVPECQVNPRGAEVSLTPASDKLVQREVAREKIREALGLQSFTRAEAQYLAALPPEVSESQIEQAIADLESGVEAAVIALRPTGAGI
jgi:hypothetical protein